MAENTSAISIKKILVPTDFSEISLEALDYAAMIAGEAGAEIILLHVFESYMQNTMLDMRVDFTEIIEKGIQEKFKDIKMQNRNLAGIQIHSKVVVGKIHKEIERIVMEEKFPLIVMGTHGVSGVTNIGKFILGSNAYRTIQNAPCPIITLREKPFRRQIKNIVLPIDSTPESAKKIDIAIRWAKFFNAKISLLAITAFFEELFVDVKDVTDKVREAESMITKEGIAVDAKIIRHHAPSDSVLEHANRIGADLVLIITGQESQLSEMLLGSSARNIISESHVPVLSVNIRTFDKEE
jgi:nucleotide-binding universal stress UspA family protein